MLGLIIGAVSTISLLVFLHHDPKAVQQLKQQKKKQAEQREAQMKKAQEQRDKIINDPANIQKRQERRQQLKQKMMKGLTEEEKKLLGDYISEQKGDGKTDQQIMKEAGLKAFALIFILMFITVIAVVLIFVIASGKEQDLVNTFHELKELATSLVTTTFPRFMNGTSTIPSVPENIPPVPGQL